MAKGTRAQQAFEAGRSASENPYVRRLVEDPELRENIRTAYESAKKAYGRMSNGKGPAKALVEDKKVHKELRHAAESLREASDQLRGRRRSRPWGKLLMLAVIGAGLALVLNEDLFGAEEEFEYSSTTTPAGSPAGNAS
jgi:hypothetical protein